MLQNGADVITNWGSYYKLVQTLLQFRAAITNWGNYYKLRHNRDSYDDFDHIFRSKLNKHAPKNKKWIRGNNKPHVNKALCQTIMKRSSLKNKANRTKDPTDIKNYEKQRNYVANLNKQKKLEYFSKFESNGNEPFWVNCKPYFTNKHSKADTDIMLSGNGELILKNNCEYF